MFQIETHPQPSNIKNNNLATGCISMDSGNKEFQSGITNHSDEMHNQNNTVSTIFGTLFSQGGQHNEGV